MEAKIKLTVRKPVSNLSSEMLESIKGYNFQLSNMKCFDDAVLKVENGEIIFEISTIDTNHLIWVSREIEDILKRF